MTEACSPSLPCSADVRQLITAGLPRGSVPRQIRHWIEEQGWKVVKISQVPCSRASTVKYAVRFDTLGDRLYDVTTRVLHGLPSRIWNRAVRIEVECPRPILNDTQLFTHVYILDDIHN